MSKKNDLNRAKVNQYPDLSAICAAASLLLSEGYISPDKRAKIAKRVNEKAEKRRKQAR